ncbi:acetyl esterase/lipase [Paraburkholderia sp. HC6.4b]|uniref:alpha/beta hydrolase n=1 Tax=unclassified Paraburkholderia TaxID=2615204 RepID=UPI00160F0178|nr:MULTISPECIES: alpha/beta hydrolase [unclassified Paraburkholderia]MBB5411756.1 acetyl esterase/lipase [Paraburkholderia sp. HC6.4b]MBB5450068.1 acetyl esterase/lipase [Paraburkholderia sp. Kb1A]
MLEPEIAAFIERASALYPSHHAAMTPREQRELYDRYAATLTPPLPSELTTRDASFRTDAGHAIPLRLYRHRAKASEHGTIRGTVLYFHGGGFVLGSLNSHQMVTARLAADTGLDVIAVDYRLAPEHRAPAAHDDCLAITRAALNHRLPFDLPERAALQLAGDSAGGTLAASVALRLRDECASGVRGIALVYPMLGTEPQLPARDTESDAPMLTLADVHKFRDAYWGKGEEADPTPGPAWTIPLAATRFDGLPPTLAIGAEHDPLRDDARVFVERIREAGGDARLLVGTGLVHGCWRALETSPGVQAMHRAVCEFLRENARH